MTPARTIRKGRYWEIVSTTRGDRNEVTDFIKYLPIPDKKKVIRMLRDIADAEDGPFMYRNDQKMKHLTDRIYELKPGAVRLLFFVDRPSRMVLTSGFRKGAELSREIARAKVTRSAYYEEG